LMERSKLVVEPAGAVGVAALLEGKLAQLNVPAKNVVAVLSGGNIDPMLMLRVIQHGLSAADRFLTLKLMLKDRPGELAQISKIIADTDANVIGVDHSRIGGELSMGDVSIVINLETKGQERSEEHTSELQSRFDLVCRLLLDK